MCSSFLALSSAEQKVPPIFHDTLTHYNDRVIPVDVLCVANQSARNLTRSLHQVLDPRFLFQITNTYRSNQ